MHAAGLTLSTICSSSDEAKNTLRFLKGEDLITHLGLEYYDCESKLQPALLGGL